MQRMRAVREASPARRMLLLAVAFAVLIGGYYLGNQYQRSNSGGLALLHHPARSIAPFSLQRAGEEGLDNADLAGHWSLFYFGDSYCDDLCPAAMVNIVELYDQLLARDPGLRRQLRVIFVSLDPLRDTPERLRSYVAVHHPDFTGVSGSQEAVADLAREFSIFHQRSESGVGRDYRVDHSVTLSLVNPQGRIAAYFIDLSNPARLADEILKLISS
jgi:protein SCO1